MLDLWRRHPLSGVGAIFCTITVRLALRWCASTWTRRPFACTMLKGLAT